MIFLKQLKSLYLNSYGFTVGLQLNNKYLMNEGMSINVTVIRDYVLGNQSSDVDRVINKGINSTFSSFSSLKKISTFCSSGTKLVYCQSVTSCCENGGLETGELSAKRFASSSTVYSFVKPFYLP